MRCRMHIHSLRQDKRQLLRLCGGRVDKMDLDVDGDGNDCYIPAFATSRGAWIFQRGEGTTLNDVSSHLLVINIIMMILYLEYILFGHLS